jgi:hypothetical protein
MSPGSPVLPLIDVRVRVPIVMPSHQQAILPLSVDSKGAQKVHTVRTKPFPPEFGTLWYGRGFVMSASDRIKRRALNSAVECHPHTLSRHAESRS